MENHMMIFKNPAFGEVRTIKGENNTPWFVGNDVAKALGYKNFRDALSRHVDEEDNSPGGYNRTPCILFAVLSCGELFLYDLQELLLCLYMCNPNG